jgi:hypothetical protein
VPLGWSWLEDFWGFATKRRLPIGLLCVLAVVACDPTGSTSGVQPLTAPSRPASTLASGPTTGPAPAPVTLPDGGTALAALSSLAVKGRAPLTGYSRAAFGPAWEDVDHNGCDTRNDILGRDLGAKVMSGSCTVLSGVLHDPYTAKVIAFHRGVGTSSKVQIDHVVALGDAWQMGAQQLSASARAAFANDPLELLAVDGPTNLQKGDSDAASWLPPNKAFRCSYGARQIAVKVRYRLGVTAAEKAALARVLATCPGQPIPIGATPIVGLLTTVPVVPPPTKPPTTAPAGLPTVHPGAFCTPPGALGITAAGTPMVCRLDSKGLRYRWGHA